MRQRPLSSEFSVAGSLYISNRRKEKGIRNHRVLAWMTIIQITRSPIAAALHGLRLLAFQQHPANSILDKRIKIGYTGQLRETRACSLII
jgi:hypothetical protein